MEGVKTRSKENITHEGGQYGVKGGHIIIYNVGHILLTM